MSILGLIGAIAEPILKPIFGIIDKAVPDKAEAARLKADIQTGMMDLQRQTLDASRDIIVAETQGGSWLQRNWRPMTMMIFVALIVSWWLGFTPDRATPELMDSLFDLIKIGMGGYVLGRSGEKIAKAIKWNGPRVE